MINRARILIAENKLDPNRVVINFVHRSVSGSHIYPIHILDNGDFSPNWPDGYGFFDERYHDTMRILQLKQKRTTEPNGNRS
jgi:predicted ATPase